MPLLTIGYTPNYMDRGNIGFAVLQMNGKAGLTPARLSAIRVAAERGATLTGHLLAFASRQPLMPKAVDLNAMIQGMRDLLDSALGMVLDQDAGVDILLMDLVMPE